MSLTSSETQIESKQPQQSPEVAAGATATPEEIGQQSAQKGQASELNGFLKGGAEAKPLDAGMRGKAEKSLGMDLGGVRVHQGEGAQAAASDLGAKAFAHGQDIVLGADVANDTNPIMAHELAHVAQQQGAAPGVAKKSEKGSSGSAYEHDADQAAGSIMMGLPAKVQQTGAESVMCFEGAEHMALGNAAWGGRTATVGQVTLPAGAFTALQGDFFGTFEEMQRACETNPKLIYDYYEVLVREKGLREAHERDPLHNAEPDSNGPIMVASARNGRSPMDYLGLAATNFNHFSEQNVEGDKLFNMQATANPAYAADINDAHAKFGHNIAQWLSGHMGAAKSAFEDGLAGRELGGVGIAMDASASHYLTDSFAAGHMRVPRMEMYNAYQAHFRLKAHVVVNHTVDQIPSEIDLSQFLAAIAPMGTGALIPSMKVSTASVKTAIRAKLSPLADSLGNSIGEKIAGFSAKVLHDHDNETGVHVFSDENKAGWEAKGDHALVKSKENEAAAIACTTASAKHVQDLHAMGTQQRSTRGPQAGQGTNVVMPYKTLKPITGKIPQLSAATKAEDSGPGEARDWHLTTMSDDYWQKIKGNAMASIVDTVKSGTAAVKDMIRDAIHAQMLILTARLGAVAGAIQGQIDAIVNYLLTFVPVIDVSAWAMQMVVR